MGKDFLLLRTPIERNLLAFLFPYGDLNLSKTGQQIKFLDYKACGMTGLSLVGIITAEIVVKSGKSLTSSLELSKCACGKISQLNLILLLLSSTTGFCIRLENVKQSQTIN